MKEPISTLSSVFFIAVAGLIAWLGAGSAPLLIVSLIILGVASVAFHASGSARRTPAHRIDEGSIYGMAVALLYHAWWQNIWVLVGATVLLAVVMLNLNKINLFRVLPFLLAAIAAGIAVRIGIKEAGIATGAGAVAIAVRTLLNQTDFVHGLWHLLGALSIGLAWYVMQ